MSTQSALTHSDLNWGFYYSEWVSDRGTEKNENKSIMETSRPLQKENCWENQNLSDFKNSNFNGF